MNALATTLYFEELKHSSTEIESLLFEDIEAILLDLSQEGDYLEAWEHSCMEYADLQDSKLSEVYNEYSTMFLTVPPNFEELEATHKNLCQKSSIQNQSQQITGRTARSRSSVRIRNCTGLKSTNRSSRKSERSSSIYARSEDAQKRLASVERLLNEKNSSISQLRLQIQELAEQLERQEEVKMQLDEDKHRVKELVKIVTTLKTSTEELRVEQDNFKTIERQLALADDKKKTLIQHIQKLRSRIDGISTIEEETEYEYDEIIRIRRKDEILESARESIKDPKLEDLRETAAISSAFDDPVSIHRLSSNLRVRLEDLVFVERKIGWMIYLFERIMVSKGLDILKKLQAPTDIQPKSTALDINKSSASSIIVSVIKDANSLSKFENLIDAESKRKTLKKTFKEWSKQIYSPSIAEMKIRIMNQRRLIRAKKRVFRIILNNMDQSSTSKTLAFIFVRTLSRLIKKRAFSSFINSFHEHHIFRQIQKRREETLRRLCFCELMDSTKKQLQLKKGSNILQDLMGNIRKLNTRNFFSSMKRTYHLNNLRMKKAEEYAYKRSFLIKLRIFRVLRLSQFKRKSTKRKECFSALEISRSALESSRSSVDDLLSDISSLKLGINTLQLSIKDGEEEANKLDFETKRLQGLLSNASNKIVTLKSTEEKTEGETKLERKNLDQRMKWLIHEEKEHKEMVVLLKERQKFVQDLQNDKRIRLVETKAKINALNTEIDSRKEEDQALKKKLEDILKKIRFEREEVRSQIRVEESDIDHLKSISASPTKPMSEANLTTAYPLISATNNMDLAELEVEFKELKEKSGTMKASILERIKNLELEMNS